MIKLLTTLSEQLEINGFLNEASEVKELVKQAIYNRSYQSLKLLQNPQYRENLTKLLTHFGFKTTPESAINLLNAAAYLREGATDNNFRLAGLSLIAIIPGMEPVFKIILSPSGKADPALALQVAKLIIQNQGTVQAKLSKFKEPQSAASTKAYIPNGQLLTTYSDRMWSAVRNWALLTIKSNEKAQLT